MDRAASPEAPARRGAPVSGAPRVGVSACFDAGRRLRAGAEYWYLNRNYTRALAAAGALPLVLCSDTPPGACAELCEGLVLSGGGDLPHGFHDASFVSGGWRGAVGLDPESDERIAWERALIDAFAERGKPVLGVCFGMQLLNLHFGGTLRTRLDDSDGSLDHGGGGRSTAHALSVASSGFFGGLALPSQVSSSHRQGIADVAPGFIASAWASDGLVEAIECGDLVGVEWHPENDGSGPLVYRRFTERVLSRRR